MSKFSVFKITFALLAALLFLLASICDGSRDLTIINSTGSPIYMLGSAATEPRPLPEGYVHPNPPDRCDAENGARFASVGYLPQSRDDATGKVYNFSAFDCNTNELIDDRVFSWDELAELNWTFEFTDNDTSDN